MQKDFQGGVSSYAWHERKITKNGTVLCKSKSPKALKKKIMTPNKEKVYVQIHELDHKKSIGFVKICGKIHATVWALI